MDCQEIMGVEENISRAIREGCKEEEKLKQPQRLVGFR